MKKEEQFRLALKGWKYKATLNNWYLRPPKPGTFRGLTVIGEDGLGEVQIPPHVIAEKRRVNGKVVIFLENNTCYALGTERDGKEKES